MAKTEDPGAKDGYQIIVDNRPHRWPDPTITGAQFKDLAGVDPASFDVWQDVRGPEDKLINDTETVNLTRRGAGRAAQQERNRLYEQEEPARGASPGRVGGEAGGRQAAVVGS
jgi:hypothetical protein